MDSSGNTLCLRWLSLVGTIWLQATTGTNFNFPAYSTQLKTLLSMSQLQLNNLAFASDAGKIFGFVAGIAATYFPLWFLLLIGSSLGLIGYGVQYLVLALPVSSVSYWQLFLLSSLAGNSICWINTVCYVVLISNFPSNQTAVGLSTSYQSLSAKIYTAMVGAVLSLAKGVGKTSPDKRAKLFLFLSAFLPLVACIVTAPFTGLINGGQGKGVQGEGKRRRKRDYGFIPLFAITISTGIYAVITSLKSVTRWLWPPGNAIGLGIFLLAPLFLPLIVKLMGKKGKNVVHVISENEVEEDGCVRNKVEVGVGEAIEEQAVAMEEVGALVMVRRVDFWLYFFVYMFSATIGQVFMNNLGQIADSRGAFEGTASLVSLSSSFGFFGRLLPSLIDYFFSSHSLSKPASIAALMAPMCGSFFLLINKSEAMLYISTAVIGVSTGAITSLAISVTTELFGVKNFSTNHNVLVSNIPLGSFLFGSLAALVYRHKGEMGLDGGISGGCVGTECYSMTFIIWGSLCSVGTILALILHVRTRSFYRSQRS